MSPADALGHYQVLTSLLAPALLMAATGSLLVSANNRLARVVDRLRALVAQRPHASDERRPGLDVQISRHRRRSRYVLHACVLLYFAVGGFVGTSLALAVDAYSGFRLPLLPTALALAGVLCLLAASLYLGLEVTLAVRSFDEELDLESIPRTDRT
jgi:type VI protein secretion system component VasF